MADADLAMSSRTHLLTRQPCLVWLLPLLAYVVLVIPAAWVRRGHINPDGICYIRLAVYLLRGDWGHCFSGYWSPLFPWCIAPFMAIGLDGLAAADVVNVVAGALFLLTSYRLLRRLKILSPLLVLWIMLIASLITVRMAVRIITPDLLLAAILMGYLSLVAGEDVLHMRRSFAAGCVGAVAYLAKAYAMPFFLAHFPLTLLLRWLATRRNANASERATMTLIGSFAAGLVGFAIVAGPWIALLSHSYGRLTMGTAGAINHNQAEGAPAECKHKIEFSVPDEPYIIDNEAADRKITRFWSPFDSAARLKQQWHIFTGNSGKILVALGRMDGLWLVPLLSLVGLGLILTGRRPGALGAGWQISWLLMTLAVFCSGFTMVYFEPRLIEAPLRFPAILLCVFVVLELQGLCMPNARHRWPMIVLLVLLSGSALVDLAKAYTPATADWQLRDVGAAMRSQGLGGPIASNDRGIGMYLGFFLDAKVVQMPAAGSEADWRKGCLDGNVRSIVFYSEHAGEAKPHQDKGCASMLKHEGWACRQSIDAGGSRYEIYGPGSDATSRPDR